MILRVEHSARRERHVVKEPAPAIRGKTRGTIVELPSAASFLKIVMLKVISIAKAIRTIAPAIANDGISTLKNLSNPSPIKRKRTSKRKDIIGH